MPNVPKAEAVDGMTTDRERAAALAHKIPSQLECTGRHDEIRGLLVPHILAHDRETRRLALEEAREAVIAFAAKRWLASHDVPLPEEFDAVIRSLLDKEAP